LPQAERWVAPTAESTHRAPCGIDAVYGAPAFNDSCPSWQPRRRAFSITLRAGSIEEVRRQLADAATAIERLRGLVKP
jgi:hypothetical protein